VLAIAIIVAVILILHPDHIYLYPLIVILPLIFAVLMIIPIGGADMPTVISLLNSYAGLSAA
jgi:NAD(P) transhydrogenase subunit beta